ncbi:MAG: hypothetical protein P0116_01510 [Candidatus Nitrosocosmicus sp.]|nr:hypothetical protein [Candidatus Nitrosocosmicus sp.]
MNHERTTDITHRAKPYINNICLNLPDGIGLLLFFPSNYRYSYHKIDLLRLFIGIVDPLMIRNNNFIQKHPSSCLASSNLVAAT